MKRCFTLAILASTGLACAHARTTLDTVVTELQTAAAAVLPDPEPTADELLEQAQNHVQAGEYSQARTVLGSVVERWPAEPVAGEAHYLIGESYFDQGKCKEALFTFGRVMQDFPTSPSAPNAYLRSAACFRLLNMPAEATLALEEVKKQYAQDAAAAQADKMLAQLKKKHRRGSKGAHR